MKLCLAPLAVLSVFAAVLAIGCTSEEPNVEDEAEPSSMHDELNASCRYPRRYLAVLAEGTCNTVVAKRGQWVPSPLFPDAPPESGSCYFSWSGEKYAPVDRKALQDYVTFPGALTASCGPDIYEAEVEQIPLVERHRSVGAVGCDVCGLEKNGRVWVVLPPEKVLDRQFEIPLTDGSKLAFQIARTPGLRATSMMLPPPPPGTQYVDGRFLVY